MSNVTARKRSRLDVNTVYGIYGRRNCLRQLVTLSFTLPSSTRDVAKYDKAPRTSAKVQIGIQNWSQIC